MLTKLFLKFIYIPFIFLACLPIVIFFSIAKGIYAAITDFHEKLYDVINYMYGAIVHDKY